MKTVLEVSNELGLSKQAIYKKIHIQLKDELKKHIKRGSKGIEITESGVEIIKNSLESKQSTNSQQVENDFIERLNKTIETLEKQLDAKDNQILNLQKQNENMQVLMLGLQQQTQLLLEGSAENGLKEKRKLFSWFK